MKFARTRLEKIFDGDVLDFVLDTHISNLYQCDKYKDFPGYNCDPKKGTTAVQSGDASGVVTSVVQTDCGSKVDAPPEKLKKNWIN